MRLRCPFWNWIKMSTVENHPRCGLLMSDWHNITFRFKLNCPITEHLEMKWITRNKNLEEEFFVKNTIFTLPASNYKLMEISPRKKNIWTILPFIQEDMENEFYIYRGYMYIYMNNIYIYIYIYSNCTLSTWSVECVAARRAAPTPDPSSVTLRMTCWAASSPNISIMASCKYSLNIV